MVSGRCRAWCIRSARRHPVRHHPISTTKASMSTDLSLLYSDLRYLILTNILAARTFLSQFLLHLQAARPAIFTQPSSPLTIGDTKDEVYPTTDPAFNFFQLAIRTCQRGNGMTLDQQRDARNAWVRLCGRYVTRGGLIGSEPMKEVRFGVISFWNFVQMSLGICG